MLGTPGIKVVLANTFGDNTLCDEVARGVFIALGEVETFVPLVVRPVGTNQERGTRS